jgi:hypothetical protein
LWRCDNSARVSAGGTNRLKLTLPAVRCAASTRRYSSQRDEFHRKASPRRRGDKALPKHECFRKAFPHLAFLILTF